MNSALAFFLIFISGIINGSFVTPTKYLPNWKYENVWLNFAVWNFVLLPWSLAAIFLPQILHVYAASPPNLIWLIIIFGMVFGVGQIFFSLALVKIGFGLGFLINLGLGIGLGYLLPLALQHPEKIVTPFGLITISGVAIAIFGLVLANKAGQLRNHEQNTLKGLVENEAKKVNQYKIGMILAIASGFSTGTQNLAFSFTFSMQDMALQMGSSPFGASTILWPLYLTCSLVPTSLFYLYLHKKNKSFSCYLQPQKFKYFFLTFFMAVLWYGPVMLYSLGAKTLGNLGPLIGWPMYLILVILASNFWGWKHKEWENCSSKAKKIMLNSLCILIIAIVVLACGQFFT